tara:strand:+ start:6004 stop:6201 length:198 start_codon:yes stop_codon:yes gene_type:complete
MGKGKLMMAAWIIVLIAAFHVGLGQLNFDLIGLLTNDTLIMVFEWLVLLSALYGLYSMFTMKHKK